MPIRNAMGPALAGFVFFCAFPAHAEDLKPICSDRPGRGAVACTVDPGHWQAELSLWDATFQHRAGVTIDVIQAANPTIKYGLSDSADIEASMALYQSVRVHDGSGSRTASGVGDLFLRAKWNPNGGENGDFVWLFDPFIKLPTAGRDLGNGEVEGGLMVPMTWTFGGNWALVSTPEVDLLLNGSGAGYHGELLDVIGLCRDIGSGLNLAVEVWTSQNLDPQGTQSQYGIGPRLAWLSDPNDQFDAGLAVGLNRPTPDLELYVGFSRRF